ncbi:MAG TPA: hypothetical protein VMN57_00035, partial [Anaerolineales bacterium]|nr:hypothetical protein [Anaerolineales bacterium]
PTPFSLKGLLIAAWLILVSGAYYVTHKPLDGTTALRLVQTAWDLGAAGLLVLAAGGIGRWLLPNLPVRPAARMAVQAAFGLGVLGLVQLAAGSVFGVSARTGWISALLLLAVFRRPTLHWLRDLSDMAEILQAGGRFGLLVAALTAAGLGLTFITAALPPAAFDALVYHLALPRVYLETGRFGFVPDNFFWGMPQTGELLYTWALSLTGRPETAALLGWCAGALALVGTLGYATQLLGARAGWAAAAALLAGATVLNELAWAYVDWFAYLFGLGCLAALHAAGDPGAPGRRGRIAWAGALAGFALGTKYSAGALLLAGLATLLLDDDPYAGRRVYARRLGNAVVFGLAAAAAFAPWPFKNVLAVGNPLHPFFIPTGEMTAERLVLYTGQPAWGGWENAVLLPWQATMTGLEGAPGFAASIGPLLLALGVLAPLGWGSLSPDARRGVRQAAVIAAVGLVTWAVAGRLSGLLIQSRLYFALFPALAVLAGAGFRGLDRFDWPGVRLGRIAGLVCLLVLGLNVLQTGAGALRDGAQAAFLGLKELESYSTGKLGMYHLAMAAVNDLPSAARVLMLYEPRGLACVPHCDPDEFLDRWTTDAAANRHDPNAIIAAWRSAGYTHLLYFRTGAEFFREDARFPAEDWLALNAVVNALEPVVDLDGVYILFVLP